jgi:cytochrome c-type protein NapB
MTMDRPPFSHSPASKLSSRWGTVLGSLACGLGLAGFLTGINQQTAPRDRQSLNWTKPSEETLGALAPAPTYDQIDSRIYGFNRDWRSDLSRLRQDNPGLLDPVIRTPEMKAQALQDRLRTRAFDTAPPAVPHPVDQRTAESCLACHGNGMTIAGKTATRMSHPLLTNCTQCHVEQAGSVPQVLAAHTNLSNNAPEAAWPPGNRFDGVKRAGPGTRLLPGLPPTIPHTLHMRDDCMSCHGLIARPGIRTTHPWLQNCRQCHVANDDLERPAVSIFARKTDAAQR